MTFNSAIAPILRYISPNSGFRVEYSLPVTFFAKTDPRNSRTVSLRQLNCLLSILVERWFAFFVDSNEFRQFSKIPWPSSGSRTR